jgi:hypothetical protein
MICDPSIGMKFLGLISYSFLKKIAYTRFLEYQQPKVAQQEKVVLPHDAPPRLIESLQEPHLLPSKKKNKYIGRISIGLLQFRVVTRIVLMVQSHCFVVIIEF